MLNTPTEEIIIYILVTVVTLLILWIIRLEIKIKNIQPVKQNQNISNQIKDIQKNLSTFNNFEGKIKADIQNINTELTKTIKGIETIRFNPFKDGTVGGNQSFATAMLDESGNGVVISSLYSREKVSVFAKPIKNWISEHELSVEEKEVIERVKQK